jgi:hypothetical protein
MQHDKVIGASEYDDVRRANREACDGLIALGYDGNVMSTDDDSLLPYPKKKRRKKAGSEATAIAATAIAAAAAPNAQPNVGAAGTAAVKGAATTAAGTADIAFATTAIADPGFHHYYFPDGTAIARAGFL